MCLVSKWAILHFHDYGRKGKLTKINVSLHNGKSIIDPPWKRSFRLRWSTGDLELAFWLSKNSRAKKKKRWQGVIFCFQLLFSRVQFSDMCFFCYILVIIYRNIFKSLEIWGGPNIQKYMTVVFLQIPKINPPSATKILIFGAKVGILGARLTISTDFGPSRRGDFGNIFSNGLREVRY